MAAASVGAAGAVSAFAFPEMLLKFLLAFILLITLFSLSSL